MIANELELVVFGAWLANPELRPSIPIEILSGSLSDLLTPPNATMAKRVWDWLKPFGVRQVDQEKPLEAIVRVLIEQQKIRKHKQDIRKVIRENCDVASVTQLRELLDQFLPHSDPKPERIR